MNNFEHSKLTQKWITEVAGANLEYLDSYKGKKS